MIDRKQEYNKRQQAKSYKFNLYLSKKDEQQIAKMLDDAKKNQGMKKLIVRALKALKQ